MNVEVMCQEVFNFRFTTALKQPHLFYKVIKHLQYKGYNFKEIAKLCNVKISTIEKHANKENEKRPILNTLPKDQEMRIKRFLKIEHYGA